jgi:Uma2 family endonuclease
MESITSTKKRSANFLSIEKYLVNEEKSKEKHEYINGKIRKMPGSTFNHNKIATNVIIELGQIFRERKLTFDIISSDQKVYIPNLNQILYPDALVVYEKPEFWNNRKDILLNPILIVEVLSPTTEKYDRHDKFMSYKNIPSFKEYVMVRQEKVEVETWYREEPHLWRESVYNEGDEVKLSSIGVSIEIDKIYRNIEF